MQRPVLARLRRLPRTARMAVRVAGVMALATGGIALGRGVVGTTSSRGPLVEVAGVSAPSAETRPALAAEAHPADAQPVFTSSLRSWAAATSTPVPATEQLPAMARVAEENTPEPRLRLPGPTSAPVQLPATRPPVAESSTPQVQGAATPDDAVRSFYAYVLQGQYGDALGLWSQQMQRSYPPAENINSRFARTQDLRLDRVDVVDVDSAHGRATVAVRLAEVVGPPTATRQYTGNWYLVRGPGGWLLDQPSLRQTS